MKLLLTRRYTKCCVLETGEGELLFPPLCNLEMVRFPRDETYGKTKGTVVSFKISINQKANTIEEILGQRKKTVHEILENLTREIKFDLQLFGVPFESSDIIKGLPTLECDDWYNQGPNFRKAIDSIIDFKEQFTVQQIKTKLQAISSEESWLLAH